VDRLLAGTGVALRGGALAQPPEALHPLEPVRAALLANRLAEHRAEQVDVLAERHRDAGPLDLDLEAPPAAPE
jgi:hypothetical protein